MVTICQGYAVPPPDLWIKRRLLALFRRATQAAAFSFQTFRTEKAIREMIYGPFANSTRQLAHFQDSRSQISSSF